MLTAAQRGLLLVGSLLCVSCERSAIDRAQSLVGAEHLPPSSALSRETIYLNRGGDAYGLHPHVLSYELRADDTLVVTHTTKEGNEAREVVRGRQSFRLSRDRAARARRMLWRVRPATLNWPDEEVRPLGCERRGPHDFGEITVAFVKESGKARAGNHLIGVFELPYPNSCDTPSAAEARNLISGVFQSFPPSRVAAEFPEPS